MSAARRLLLGLAISLPACDRQAPEAVAPPTVQIEPDSEASCSPTRMVRVVLQDDSAEDAPTVTIHRLGSRYGRIDVRGTDGKVRSTIVDEPNSWIIDPTTNRVTHHVDERPSPRLRLRLFGGANYPDWLSELEVGCELDFFARNGVPGTIEATIEGRLRTRILSRESFEVRFVSDPITDTPRQVILYDEGALVGFVDYLDYAANLPPRLELFQP